MYNRNGKVFGFALVFILLSFFLLLYIFQVPARTGLIIFLSSLVFFLAFTNTNFALIILIFSMLLSPELKTAGIPGRAVVIRLDDLFLLVIFLGWMAKMAVHKELGFSKITPLNRPIVSYVFVSVLASLIGILSRTVTAKHSFFYLLKYTEYFVLFFMVVNNLKTLKESKVFVLCILLTCLIVSAYGWMQIPSGQRITAPFEGEGGEPNTFAGYLLLMMALVLGLLLHGAGGPRWILLAGFLGFMAVPYIYTLSRGAWIAFPPLFLTFIVLQKRYRVHLIAVLLVMVVVLPHFLPKKVFERIEETFSSETTTNVMGRRVHLSESAAARVNTWSDAWEKLKRSPVFGYGTPSGTVVDNQYTRVLSESGIVGFIIFLWLLKTIFSSLWHVYMNAQGDDFAKGLSLGLIAGTIGLLMQAFSVANFILIRVMEPFWFLMAIAVSLPELMQGSQPLPAQEAAHG